MGPWLKVKITPVTARAAATLVLFLFWWAVGILAAAEEPAAPGPPEPAAGVRWGKPAPQVEPALGVYASRGSSSWQISFPTASGTGRSRLEFEDLEGITLYGLLTLQTPDSLAGIRLVYGSENLTGGNGRDLDYLSGSLDYASRMAVSGELSFWSADLETTFSGTGRRGWYLKPFTGWQVHRENLRLVDGSWTVIRGFPETQPIYGLDSRYDLEWEVLRLGLQVGIDLIEKPVPGCRQWGLKASGAFFPYARYTGEGRWNLRQEYSQAPSFRHQSEYTGWCGWEGSLGVYYRPWEPVEFEGGARAAFFQAGPGNHAIYFSDGSSLTTKLDEAETQRVGLYLQVTGRF